MVFGYAAPRRAAQFKQVACPDTTALVEVGTGGRAPKVRGPLPPTRLLIEHLRSTDLAGSRPAWHAAGRGAAVSAWDAHVAESRCIRVAVNVPRHHQRRRQRHRQCRLATVSLQATWQPLHAAQREHRHPTPPSALIDAPARCRARIY